MWVSSVTAQPWGPDCVTKTRGQELTGIEMGPKEEKACLLCFRDGIYEPNENKSIEVDFRTKSPTTVLET